MIRLCVPGFDTVIICLNRRFYSTSEITTSEVVVRVDSITNCLHSFAYRPPMSPARNLSRIAHYADMFYLSLYIPYAKLAEPRNISQFSSNLKLYAVFESSYIPIAPCLLPSRPWSLIIIFALSFSTFSI